MGIKEDIAALKIQSANTTAIKVLQHLKKFSKKYGFGKKFEKEARELAKIRKTPVLVYNLVKIILETKDQKLFDKLIKKIKLDNENIARYGEKLIKNNYVVHTHCHSTSAIAVIKEAAKKKKFMVVADETRPKLQGIKTAKELSRVKNIKVILITDDAAGIALSPFIPPNDDIVIVGADAIRKEGIVNKIGTYLLAVAASEQGIPFYVAASTLKYDTRKKLIIEERPTSEVYKGLRNIIIRNPAFDLTPWKYITGVITEERIKRPGEILKELQRFERGEKRWVM